MNKRRNPAGSSLHLRPINPSRTSALRLRDAMSSSASANGAGSAGDVLSQGRLAKQMPQTAQTAQKQAVTSKLDLHTIPDDKPLFSCAHCAEVVALQDELMSKAFNGRSGRSYLMNTTINTDLGLIEERHLTTGMHTVADLLCASCHTSLGWKYLKTPNSAERYKEGRYILEATKIVKENNW